MLHTILTFITNVHPDKVNELDALLKEIADDLTGNPHLPFRALKLLHFASLVLHEDKTYGPYLIFENNFDGPLDPYLDELYTHAAEGLHRIYACCRDYPATSSADREKILGYLRAHVVRPNAYHIGNVGRSAERIRQEAGLREKCESYADSLASNGQPSMPPSALRQQIQQFVTADATLSWVANVGQRQTPLERFIPWVRLRLTLLIALVLLLMFWYIVVPLIIAYIIVLRWNERHDPVWSGAPKDKHLQQLTQREDRTHSVQNHMASITAVKPGRFRRLTLKGVLWVVNLVARTSTNGTLSGIPSIHFAHWSLIDNDRRLLFLSNFDGSWENYLDDFIDKASQGLTAIWGNTVDFPRTRWLIGGGASDGPRFKAIARAKQVYTTVWYSAYRTLTVRSIDNNSSIREDMLRQLDAPAVKTWLQRF